MSHSGNSSLPPSSNSSVPGTASTGEATSTAAYITVDPLVYWTYVLSKTAEHNIANWGSAWQNQALAACAVLAQAKGINLDPLTSLSTEQRFINWSRGIEPLFNVVPGDFTATISVELISLRFQIYEAEYSDEAGCEEHLQRLHAVTFAICPAIAAYWAAEKARRGTDFDALQDFAMEAEAFLDPILSAIPDVGED